MIALSRLKNSAHIDFHKKVYTSLSQQADLSPTVRELLCIYIEAINSEQAAGNRVYRSEIVAKRREADQRRDEAFRHLRLLIKCLKFKSGGEIQEAYEAMAKACQKTFSSQITKLSREHKQARMTAFLQMIHENEQFLSVFEGFQESYVQLQESNLECMRLDGLRIEECSEFKAGLTLSARAETDNIYRLIIKALEFVKEINNKLGKDVSDSTEKALEIIDSHEKVIRRYLKVTATWRAKRNAKVKDDRTGITPALANT